MPNIELKVGTPNEIRKTLRLALAAKGQTAAELERHVTGFLHYARELNLDISRHWLCETEDGETLGGVCIESPGRTAMLILTPGHATSASEEALAVLINGILDETSSRDIRLYQCLVTCDDTKGQAALLGTGFREIAVLLYMECAVSPAGRPPQPEVPAGLRHRSLAWSSYGEATHDVFASLIAATYRESLDCPGLTDLRDIEDVIAGHKAAGRFVGTHWRLLCVDGEPAGCILLAENPTRLALELVYTGVHPRFRGHGLGQYIVRHGLSIAQADGFPLVTLAVDSKNKPALAMYAQTGFHETTSRRAFIRLPREY